MNADKKHVNPPKVDSACAQSSDDNGSTNTSMTLDSLLKPFAGNVQFYRRLLTIFQANLTEQLLTIDTLMSLGDSKALLVTVHTLKGTSGTAGFASLHRALYDFELALKQLSDSDGLNAPHIVNLATHVAAVAHTELNDIHALLATSNEQTVSHTSSASTLGIQPLLKTLKQQLIDNNLDAIELCQQLQANTANNSAIKPELSALIDAVEQLDFSQALHILATIDLADYD